MNEKVQKFMEKVDVITEKCNILPNFLDYGVDFLKKPAVSCIPTFINKITSKFSLVTIALFGIVYIIYCLKNMVISFLFESGPSGMSFALVIIAIIATALSSYIVSKTAGVFDKIIATSQCRISSLNIFAIMVLVFQFLTVASLVGGIYLTFEMQSFLPLVAGIIGAIIFFLLALYNSTPEEFAVVQDENASAGEDFSAIATFAIKVVLRLVPIIVFAVPIIGIVKCVPEVFTTYTSSFANQVSLESDIMIAMMSSLAIFLFVGFIPLIAYIYYLVSYVSLDLIRAVLSLPQKLDDLKK